MDLHEIGQKIEVDPLFLRVDDFLAPCRQLLFASSVYDMCLGAEAERYTQISNPFGSVDATQVELTDVAEGSDHYDAVRFAFEEGFMGPQTEDRFGVDAPATQGDLLAALYVLVGGARDENEALAAFVAYGIVTEDTDLSAPILPEDIWGLLSTVAGQEVAPMTETARSDAVTRGELAEALMAFVEGMA